MEPVNWHNLSGPNNNNNKSSLPYSAKFSRAVNFVHFVNSNSIAKIIFVKIIIIDLLCQN